MKRKAILFPCIAGIFMAVIFIGMASAAQSNSSVKLASGGLSGKEMALNPGGGAFEINQDPQGKLVVSDYFGEEIWLIDPARQVYTTYLNIPAPGDARGDNAGRIWWAEGKNNRLGRLTLETLTVDYWDIPGAALLYNTGLDASGRVWISDYNEDHFFRFDVSTSQVCTYTLPGISTSDYIFVHANDLWFGDLNNNRIYRLDTTSGQYTYWALPYGIYPEGITIDQNGSIWWADITLNELVHLDPSTDKALRHAPPMASDPAFLTNAGGQIWYTDWDGRLGIYNTKSGGELGEKVSRSNGTITPACSVASVAESKTVDSTSGSIEWAASSYPNLLNNTEWLIYELPENNFPWGIQANEDSVYIVDNGRQVIAQVQEGQSVTACKLEDKDGDPNTTGDQTPVESWTIHLTVDGVPVEPGQQTGTGGCTTWNNLEPGVSYGVQEDSSPGWIPLGDTSHDFGQAEPGAQLNHTFINAQTGQEKLYLFVPLIFR